jgi:peptidoglycan hydrolase-like protein with peptidoglycan-binding domain
VSIFRLSLVFVLGAALTVPTVFASRVHRAPTSGQTHKSRRPAHNKAHKMHGQQVIAPERATQIQQALIREHYMSGEPTGKWDSTTEAAMQKYQADQGWQTKLMPDSRAIKKLGLGPDYSGAINARNSSFAEPPSASIPPVQTAGFAAAAGVTQ